MGILDPTDAPVLKPEDLQKTEEIKAEVKAPADPGAPEVKGVPDLEKLVCGYVVGLDPSGELVFEVLGNEPGLVQLLGLHKYAGNRLDIASDINLNYGIPILAKQLAEMQQMLNTILKMQTQQAKSIMGSIIKGK